MFGRPGSVFRRSGAPDHSQRGHLGHSDPSVGEGISSVRRLATWHRGVIDDLKSEVGKLAALKLEVGKLSKHWEGTVVDTSASTPGLLATVSSFLSVVISASPHDVVVNQKVDARLPARSTAEQPCGHRVESRNQEGDFGVVTTLIPPLARICILSHPSFPPFLFPIYVHHRTKWCTVGPCQPCGHFFLMCRASMACIYH